jgi:hypothetical protein
MKTLLLIASVLLLTGCGQSDEEKKIAALNKQNELMMQQQQLQQQQLQLQQQQPIQQQQYQQQPVQQAPVIVQAAPQQNGTSAIEGALMGAAAMHLLNNNNANNMNNGKYGYQQPQTVINKTVINKTYTAPVSQAPAYVAQPQVINRTPVAAVKPVTQFKPITNMSNGGVKTSSPSRFTKR